MADAGSALPFTAEFQVKPGPDWSYSWLGIAPCRFSKKLGTHVNRVVVGLSHASRVFLWVLRFPFLRKINTYNREQNDLRQLSQIELI